jgi:hypothetical protein
MAVERDGDRRNSPAGHAKMTARWGWAVPVWVRDSGNNQCLPTIKIGKMRKATIFMKINEVSAESEESFRKIVFALGYRNICQLHRI